MSERERAPVRESAKASESERQRARAREMFEKEAGEREGLILGDNDRVCESVCVCGRERERARERKKDT